MYIIISLLLGIGIYFGIFTSQGDSFYPCVVPSSFTCVDRIVGLDDGIIIQLTNNNQEMINVFNVSINKSGSKNNFCSSPPIVIPSGDVPANSNFELVCKINKDLLNKDISEKIKIIYSFQYVKPSENLTRTGEGTFIDIIRDFKSNKQPHNKT